MGFYAPLEGNLSKGCRINQRCVTRPYVILVQFEVCFNKEDTGLKSCRRVVEVGEVITHEH